MMYSKANTREDVLVTLHTHYIHVTPLFRMENGYNESKLYMIYLAQFESYRGNIKTHMKTHKANIRLMFLQHSVTYHFSHICHQSLSHKFLTFSYLHQEYHTLNE